MQRSDAITKKIKTEFSTSLVNDSELSEATAGNKAKIRSYRLSDNTVVGTQEEISSDVMLPETRIQSIPEVGSESSSGNLESEWNVDEQDPLLASVMCSSWEDVTSDYNDAHDTEYEEVKLLELGVDRDVYTMIKKYFQTPVSWEVYTGIQIDSLNISMALNQFVKMSWGLLGGNNPVPVMSEPMDLSKAEYEPAMTTKSFITRELAIQIKDLDTAEEPTYTMGDKMRQSPSFELSISNNKERTDALGEKEAIEMSDGDFVVEGTFEVWNADVKAINLKKDAILGKDKWITVSVFRDVNGTRYQYDIQMKAHLKTPSESKDGNKLKTAIPFSVNFDKGIKFIKFTGDSPSA